MEIENLYLSQEEIREIRLDILFDKIGGVIVALGIVAFVAVVIRQIFV